MLRSMITVRCCGWLPVLLPVGFRCFAFHASILSSAPSVSTPGSPSRMLRRNPLSSRAAAPCCLPSFVKKVKVARTQWHARPTTFATRANGHNNANTGTFECHQIRGDAHDICTCILMLQALVHGAAGGGCSRVLILNVAQWLSLLSLKDISASLEQSVTKGPLTHSNKVTVLHQQQKIQLLTKCLLACAMVIVH